MRALSLTEHMAQTALRGLKKEGRIKVVGTGSATRYVPTDRSSSPLARRGPSQGSLDERICAVLKDRFHASEEELGQALNEPVAVIRQACARLQAEEKIEMRRIDHRQVYVIARRA
jgi:hypothetical protein